jgi:hypothetical protein
MPVNRCTEFVLKPQYLVNLATGQCLDVRDANPYDGAPIQLWACNGGSSERWLLPTLSAGALTLFPNYRMRKCLQMAPFARQYRCLYDVPQLFTLP